MNKWINYAIAGAGIYLALNFLTKNKLSESIGQSTGQSLGGGVAGLIGGIPQGASNWATNQDYIPVIDWIAKPLGTAIGKFQINWEAWRKGLDFRV